MSEKQKLLGKKSAHRHANQDSDTDANYGSLKKKYIVHDTSTRCAKLCLLQFRLSISIFSKILVL